MISFNDSVSLHSIVSHAVRVAERLGVRLCIRIIVYLVWVPISRRLFGNNFYFNFCIFSLHINTRHAIGLNSSYIQLFSYSGGQYVKFFCFRRLLELLELNFIVYCITWFRYLLHVVVLLTWFTIITMRFVSFIFYLTEEYLLIFHFGNPQQWWWF